MANLSDAAHANNLCCCRSTTGYAFLLNYGVILYCSKILSTTATSSTKVEFLAAVTAAKHANYMPAVLLELGYLQDGPTLLYEGKMSAINMINNRVPTERSCHIDIQHFAIQDWAKAKDIVMGHTPGILSIPDELCAWLGLTLPLCLLYDGLLIQLSCCGPYFASLMILGNVSPARSIPVLVFSTIDNLHSLRPIYVFWGRLLTNQFTGTLQGTWTDHMVGYLPRDIDSILFTLVIESDNIFKTRKNHILFFVQSMRSILQW